MWQMTMQMMRKNLRMLIPAGIAILIGTAFIAATFLFGNAMDASMREQVTAQYGGANYVINPPPDAAADDDVYANTVGDFRVDALERIPGVEGARPDVSVGVTFLDAQRAASGAAIATSADAGLLPVDVVDGSAPAPGATGAIALPKRLADQWGVTVGDSLRVASEAASDSGHGDGVETRVVGLTDDPHGVYAYWGGAAVASDDVIAALAGAKDFDDLHATSLYLSLDTRDATTLGDARAKIMAQLPDGYLLQSRQAASDRAIRAMSADGGDVTRNFLLAFGVLALVVAALVIANTFQVLVAQRRRTLALLRTIGATKRQLYVSVLQEAGALGLVASALGVGVGVGLMAAVCALDPGGSVGVRMRFVPSWQVFVIPLVFGVAMTVLASVSAARTATNVTPLEAMRPIEASDQRKARLGRAVVGTLLLAVGVALIVLAVVRNGHASADAPASPALMFAVAGCALSFLGLAVTALFWLPWLMRGVGALVALCGPSARIAVANIRKNPRRIAATGTALLIGVTLVSTIATGAASAKATMNQALDTRYSVDVVASGQLSQDAADKAARVDGVERSLYLPTAQGETTTADGNAVDALIVGVPSEKALQSVMNVDLDGARLGDGRVLMSAYDAYDGARLAFRDGRTTLRERMDTGADAADETATYGTDVDLTVEQRDFRRITTSAPVVAFVSERLFEDGTFGASGHLMLIKLDRSGATLSQTFDTLQQVFAGSPTVELGGPVAERQQWESMVDVMLMLLVALLAVAVIIAVIGVANTLSLSVIERTRESATLRAIGMTRGQLRMSLAVEALLISVVASVVGMVVGTLFGWLGIDMVMGSIATVVHPVDWATYGIILAIAVVCALLASVFPARRAAKTPPVEALAEA